MSGGGKGGSQTTSVEIPAWLEAEAQQNLAKANELSQIGYTPYFGPDVAAMTPAQLASMQNTASAANAFGLASSNAGAGLPEATTYANGVSGYSSAPMYQQALDALQAAAPGQFAALQAPFIDPVTGAAPSSPYGSAATTQTATTPQSIYDIVSGGNGGGGIGGFAGGGTTGGYTSINDMFNGGGPGATGTTFSGGPLSGTLNKVGVSPVASGGSSSGMGGGK